VSATRRVGHGFGRQIADLPDRPTAAVPCSRATLVGPPGALRNRGQTPGAVLDLLTDNSPDAGHSRTLWATEFVPGASTSQLGLSA